MLDKEFKYYIEHQQELVEKYNGKVLVIIGEEVVGVFDDENEAYFSSVDQYEIGTFLIQKCSPGEESYTQIGKQRYVYLYIQYTSFSDFNKK